MFFRFFIICKRTNNANNATHYVKLGKQKRESSKRNYYIISPRVIIKAIIIISAMQRLNNFFSSEAALQNGAWSCSSEATGIYKRRVFVFRCHDAKQGIRRSRF